MFFRAGSAWSSRLARDSSEDARDQSASLIPRPVDECSRQYNSLMRPLRYLYVLALVLWLGGMAVAGFVVAPTTFGVLEAWDPSAGRVLAGQVFGAVLGACISSAMSRRS